MDLQPKIHTDRFGTVEVCPACGHSYHGPKCAPVISKECPHTEDQNCRCNW